MIASYVVPKILGSIFGSSQERGLGSGGGKAEATDLVAQAYRSLGLAVPSDIAAGNPNEIVNKVMDGDLKSVSAIKAAIGGGGGTNQQNLLQQQIDYMNKLAMQRAEEEKAAQVRQAERDKLVNQYLGYLGTPDDTYRKEYYKKNYDPAATRMTQELSQLGRFGDIDSALAELGANTESAISDNWDTKIMNIVNALEQGMSRDQATTEYARSKSFIEPQNILSQMNTLQGIDSNTTNSYLDEFAKSAATTEANRKSDSNALGTIAADIVGEIFKNDKYSYADLFSKMFN
jgi:hypothetical protein